MPTSPWRCAPFASDYGHFSDDGLEYVVTRPDTPRPWCNVLTNGDYGCIVSQAGGGFSWRGNSQLKMLNRWEQDLVRDEFGRFLYIRDAESGEFWSADWQPTKQTLDAWSVRHGLGYTVTDLTAHGIRCEKTVFVPNGFPCEVWLIRLTNLGDAPRTVDLITYLEWQLASVADWHREFHKTFVETEYIESDNAVFAWKKGDVENADRPFSAFICVPSQPLRGYDTDKETFLGRYGSTAAPHAVVTGDLAGRSGKWTDPVAAVSVRAEVFPGQTNDIVIAVGAGTREDLGNVRAAYHHVEAVVRDLEDVKAMWRGWVEAVTVDTPDTALNVMTNAWLKYQSIAGRLWARTGYYQNSGAFGFRDQLQDSHIWMPMEPDRARAQILQHASHQFSNGTVQHWWHPDTPYAAVGDCSDDLLWLAYITMNYLDETNDTSIWDATAPFVDCPEAVSLYDHCVRAFDKVSTRMSPRGLPLIGDCDWNDGLSHLGRAWKGESVWLAHFLTSALRRFSEHASERGDCSRATDYTLRADALIEAVNEHCWDGEWYWRATKDNGSEIGSHKCAENKIDLIAQSWAVIGGTAPADRARQAMCSARKYLFREYGPLLLTPAYSKTDSQIGYITRYAPGIRENGGVYTHAATWGVQALAMLGEGDAAWKAYASMSPPRRGTDPDLYFGEPYVTPGNIDGPDSPTFGRGGWTWYSGSAAWMQKVALEWICGVRPTRAGLLIDPCIPADWPGFTVHREFRGGTYEINVQNPRGVQKGVDRITVDGKSIDGQLLTPQSDGAIHSVEVVMG